MLPQSVPVFPGKAIDSTGLLKIRQWQLEQWMRECRYFEKRGMRSG
jgi:hypothetical protein